MNTRLLTSLTGAATTVALIAGPVLYAFHAQAEMRNFRVVREGVLYRSGKMTLDGLKRAVHDYGIKTVVSLRDADRLDDQAEEAFCAREEINFVRLPPKHWDTTYGPAEVEPNVRAFLEVMNDPDNYPVLVHCLAGIHRTGAYCAVYRMERERWGNAEAIAEMKAFGYENLDDEFDILGYLEQFRPSWAAPKVEPPPAPKKAHPRRGKPGAGGAKKIPGEKGRGSGPSEAADQ
jgi:protein tyrosine/serine phosphatase